MSRILIVDDEPAICWSFREALRDEGHTVEVAASAEEALTKSANGSRPHVVVMDVRLPGMDGLSAMEQLRERIGTSPIIIMTAFGNLETAVRAMEQGAFDYLLKPFDLDQATAVINRALAAGRLPAATVTNDGPEASRETLVGTSPAMQQVFKQIALVAASDVGVLITGESGTGKELVARAIHRHSRRREGVFLPVCIAALNSSLIESELFGHVKGAFTGATEDRRGLLELAAGGTLLLDEVGDIPAALQVKLLRALEQREITPVGDARPRPLDLRVLAATNRPLTEMIAAGQFREDLFFRLGVFHIHLPALRDRQEDIVPLAEYFLRQTDFDREAAGRLQFAPATREELAARRWPGNVRELRNAVEHAALVARGGEIFPEHLPPVAASPSARSSAAGTDSAELPTAIRARIEQWTATIADRNPGSLPPELYEEFLKLVEPPLLHAVLQHCQGNRAAAAQLLGLHRATLRQKLRRHGLG